MSPGHEFSRLRPAELLRSLLARRHLVAAPIYRPWQGDLVAVHETRAMVPMLVNDAAALQVVAAVRAASRLGGAMAEAGVFRGGTARLICLAKGEAPLHLFDLFGAAPELSPGAIEAEVRAHFGETQGGRNEVAALLAPFPGIHYHPGFFPDTADAIAAKRFAFVHLDLDLPATTRGALDVFMPRLLPGGILVGDDAEDPDLRALFRSYFADRPDTCIELPWGQVMIVKTA